MTSKALQSLEKQVQQLMDICAHLKKENQELKAENQELQLSYQLLSEYHQHTEDQREKSMKKVHQLLATRDDYEYECNN